MDTKVTFDEIIEACFHILDQKVYITSYQVWEELQLQNHPICKRLIEACYGNYVGKDAGSHVGPAQKIAQALGRGSDRVKVDYLNTAHIIINGYQPAGSQCGIFRLI